MKPNRKIADELKARMDSLKLSELRNFVANTKRMAKLPTFTSRRILRAFPKMMPREHIKEIWTVTTHPEEKKR